MNELQKRDIPFKIIATGQTKIHFEEFSSFLGIVKPHIVLQEKINRPSVSFFLLWAIRTLLITPYVLQKEFKNIDKKNIYFIIQGDTVSSSIGALVAKIFGVTLVHIESGDLSFNIFEPFPEELCRYINMYLADILFPQNEWAKSNLKKASGKKVNTKHNTLLESLRWALKQPVSDKEIHKYKNYYILILHRQEHVIFRREWSKTILRHIVTYAPDNLDCILLSYPITVELINSLHIETHKRKKIKTIPRLSYPDFMKVMKGAKFIATDGCTNQLESYYLGVPCLALRDRTEQVEGLGENVVLYKSSRNVVKDFMRNYKKYQRKPIFEKIKPSNIIVDYLVRN